MYSSSSSAVAAEIKVHTWVLGQFRLAVGFLHFFFLSISAGSWERELKILGMQSTTLTVCNLLEVEQSLGVFSWGIHCQSLHSFGGKKSNWRA
jgi:hypothetical protein